VRILQEVAGKKEYVEARKKLQPRIDYYRRHSGKRDDKDKRILGVKRGKALYKQCTV
jgi:hypothetical protein